MADIAQQVNFGSGPQIYHTLSYETQRSGTTIRVRFKTVTSAMSGGSYFGYNLKVSLWLNGSKVLTDGVIKENSPNQWSAITKYFPSSTGWYTVTGIKNVSTLSAGFSFTTNSGRTARTGDGTVSIPAYVNPTSPSSVTRSASIVAQPTTSFTLSWSGATAGSTAISKYRIFYSLGSGWQHIKDVTGTSTTQTLSGITSTRGTSVRFSVAAIDSQGFVSSGRPETTVQLANMPNAPSTVNVSASIVSQPTTSFTLSWSGASAGSGSISSYRIYYKTSSSASWTTLKDVTGTSTSLTLEGITSTRGATVYYTVGTINSYGLVTAGTVSKTVQLANIATIPTTLSISNYSPKKEDNITISWSGASAGSGTITNYFIDARRYTNSAWSNWSNIYDNTNTSYVVDLDLLYTDLKPKDIIQFRVGVKNSYALTAGTHKYADDVVIGGGVIRINVDGVWKQGQIYVNVGGTWKEGVGVYENVSGVWKEGL